MTCRWLGEKYDGIRCCWSPDKKVMYLKEISDTRREREKRKRGERGRGTRGREEGRGG
jgi:hypothetical protein